MVTKKMKESGVLKYSKLKERTTTMKVQEEDCESLKLKGIEENSRAANKEERLLLGAAFEDRQKERKNIYCGRY